VAEPWQRVRRLQGGQVGFQCPGCGDFHAVPVAGIAPAQGPLWQWNGDLINVTLSPSLLVRLGHYVDGTPAESCGICKSIREHPEDGWTGCYVCHSFVTNGSIQFLGDCTHKLAGQTVQLAEVGSSQFGGEIETPERD
jgi:hypothetical protein